MVEKMWHDAFGSSRKHEAMLDTWGHMYPEPGAKYYGEIVVAMGDYGDNIIVSTDFPNLYSSPQRYELEHSIFNLFGVDDEGVFRVKCCLWFFKCCNEMWLHNKEVGKIIHVNKEKVT